MSSTAKKSPFVVEGVVRRASSIWALPSRCARRSPDVGCRVEGVVLYNPGRDKVRVAAGQAIDAGDNDARPPKVRAIDVANVGGWRTGLLVYSDAPLTVVAEDLKRTAGIEVSIAPEAAGQSFRGALIVDQDRGRTVPTWPRCRACGPKSAAMAGC